MPAPKRSSSASRKSSSTAKPAAKRAGSTASQSQSAARSGAKSSATSTRKAAGRSATQAKSGAAKTASTAKSGAAKTASTAKSGAAKTSQVKSTGNAGTTRRRRASRGSEGAAEELSKGAAKPRDLVMLTRDRIQETLDDAASRGRVTRKDANELVSELVRRALQQSDEMMHELEQLLDRGLGQLESATKLARKSDSVDRLVRGADRARRTVGVGPTFPILAYDDLNGGQIQSRLGDLSKPELRKVLTYERSHANRKTVVAALEKAIG